MMKRFKKLLSALCIIALLVSSIVTVFANGDPDAEMSAEQEPVAEATVNENNKTETAPAAAVEVPAQENAPAAAEKAPAQETAPAAAEKAPVQETAPAAAEKAPVQETAPAAAEKAPAQETAPAAAEKAPAQETAPAAAEKAPAQETAPAAAEKAPAQETAPAVSEKAPVQETAPAAAEKAPVQETAPETVEETPAQKDEEPAAETVPAQEDAADLNAAPVQEDTFPADENDTNEGTVVPESNTTEEEIDELADMPVNYNEDELEELDDNGGYIDPEFVAEHSPDITPEMKYENITEMKVGSTISGSAGMDEILYYIKAAKTQNILLVVQANGNIRVRINEHAVSFTENEDGTKSYEMKVQYNEMYIIGISGQGEFKLSTEVKDVEETEETEEEIDEGSETIAEPTETPETESGAAEEITESAEANVNDENSENLNSKEAEKNAGTSEEGIVEAEQTEVENTENVPETNAETVDKNAEEVIENTEKTKSTEESVEETKREINTWVTAKYNEEDGTVTVYANAIFELDNQIVWQTRFADSGEWKKAGYGMKLTVEITEENADNFFRFRLADGEYSDEYQIHATVKGAGEEAEEAAEEIPAENETEEAIDSEETEEEPASVENIEEEITEEAAAEETVETEVEAVPEGTEETVEETEEAEEIVAETVETAEQAETEEESAEEAEPEEETAEEAEPEEETAEEAEPEEESAEEAESEEETAEEAESEEETAETEEEETTEEETEEETAEEAELLIEEQLIELGYRKIQILNQYGTNLYDNTTEEATVIGTAETGTELWIKDAEAEDWAEIYTDDETQVFLKLPEIEKQKPTDEEMLAKGYVKVFVGIDIGANVYNSMDAEEAIAHLDAGSEMWVKLIAEADRAEIYAEEENDPSLYISLVDIIARLKPEGMEDLPTRELIGNTTIYDYDILYYGTDIIMTVELVNFKEDDVYSVGWQYSTDGEEYFDIEDAHELTYEYMLDEENITYYWRASVVLMTAQK